MTKEDLYETFTSTSLSEFSQRFAKEALDEFFSQNICIPNGTNRHQFADVLHEWVEGATIESVDIDEECYTLATSKQLLRGRKYRIKPLEPVYEYKWYQNIDDVKYISEVYLTAEECHASFLQYLPETKRIRE